MRERFYIKRGEGGKRAMRVYPPWDITGESTS